MIEIRQTRHYADWFGALRDQEARKRIAVRVLRLQHGNPGDHRLLTGGVVELKIDVGPGYRVYFTRRRAALVLLLAGGDKRTQQRDIELAIRLAKESSDGNDQVGRSG
ncbi:MAG: type II toxin-antitoxin system RelE/ParE family toxin [Proteobacteria bacterium]|nr:type II toxin-antitoxin system RelE/ParE family toxin [Pseudomonadota bacterium]